LVKKWLKSKKVKQESEYYAEKRKFEMAMGKPFIIIKVEIPTGFEDLRAHFLNLEKDEQFREEVENIIKKRLTYEKRRRKLANPSRR
jgi:predicted metal-dependent phosphoesterase TrpH